MKCASVCRLCGPAASSNDPCSPHNEKQSALSQIQVSLTCSFCRGITRLMTILPSAFASRRVLNVILHPTGHCEQIEADASNSHGRAPKRKSAVVNAPTGQMSVVLPEKTESNPGRERNDFHRTGAIVEVKHRIAHDLILKTNTTRALDASFLIEKR